MVERSLFRAKRIDQCNDFVARVALEVLSPVQRIQNPLEELVLAELWRVFVRQVGAR